MEMSELTSKNDILKAQEAGGFLEYICNASRGDKQNRDKIANLLATLHNSEEIDIIEEFQDIKNQPDSAGNFFPATHILEKILPLLNAPVIQVMDCVLHLITEAGQDLAAGGLVQPFTEFCEAMPSQVDEAIRLILLSPGKYSSLLPSVLIAGTDNDIEKYVTKALEFCSHAEEVIQSNAVFALGRISFPAESDYPQRVINCLATVCETGVKDQVLNNIVRTVCNISTNDNDQVDKGLIVLSSALAKGEELTLYSASHVFGFELKKIPEQLVDALLSALIDVKPEHTGTLANIGYGVSSLLKRDYPEKGIDFLERLLLRHRGALSIEALGDLVHSITSQDIALLNKLLTRWFLNGEHILCDSIRIVIDTIHTNEPELSIDPDEIPGDNPGYHLFIARKAIGFLFFKPLSCSKILLSLMEYSWDEEVLHDIGMLLFDPILLNYSGKPYDFIKEKKGRYSEAVNLEIQKIISAIDEYLEDLKSVPDIPEMYPTQEQREVQRRSYSRKMAESYKEARKGSIMDLICSKSVLLYGKSSIMHVYDGSGKSNRMEIPLQQHSVSFEVPRQTEISPVDFDYTLRVFRNERLVEQ